MPLIGCEAKALTLVATPLNNPPLAPNTSIENVVIITRGFACDASISGDVERVMGIEPTQLAWKARILPLNYTRDVHYKAGYFITKK